MDILTELLAIVGSAAFVLILFRQAANKQPQTALRIPETFQPATPLPWIDRPRAQPDAGLPIGPGVDGSEPQARYLIDNLQRCRGVDPTEAMMAAMSRPGICTPPP